MPAGALPTVYAYLRVAALLLLALSPRPTTADVTSVVACAAPDFEDGDRCEVHSGLSSGRSLLQRDQALSTLRQEPETKINVQVSPTSAANGKTVVAGIPLPPADLHVIVPVPLYVHSRKEKCIGAKGENPLLGDPLARRCTATVDVPPVAPFGPEAATEGAEAEEAAEEEHGKDNPVILLLFIVLMLGVGNMFILERYLPFVPYTAAMFMEGLIIAVIQAIKRATGRVMWSSFDDAVSLWATADPHLILFIFLPPLVFGEAMNLNVSLVKACFGQCCLLAGPGVLIGTFLTGAAGKYILPYGWDWNICLLFGAILSATDPVAVVAIFNSLGVSPRLTMVISGESLFNDGTAYVLFQLCMGLCQGADPSLRQVTEFFLQMTTGGPFVGIVVGLLTVWFLGLSSEEHYHGDSMGQVVATVCCAYLSFFIAEEMESSGMLALVASGLVVANGAWPRFIARETLKTIWHAIEFVGNTVIFVLAGIIFGGMCFERRATIQVTDFFFLGMFYLVSMLIRIIMVGLLWVPLNYSGHSLSVQEGVVMVWSGMRGAVGLLMGVVADQNPFIDRDARTLIIFYAGGMAAIMQLINGPLTPKVLSLCGLMDNTDKNKIMSDVQQRVDKRTKEHMRKEIESEEKRALFGQAVEDIVSRMVFHAEQESGASMSPADQGSQTKSADKNQLRLLRESLLRVVKTNYWTLVDSGAIPRKYNVTKVLLDSADLGMMGTAEEDGLSDWQHVVRKMQLGEYQTEEDYKCKENLGQIQRDFEHYMQGGIMAATAFIYAHERALDDVKAFTEDRVEECLEENKLIEEVEEQNKKALAYLASVDEEMVKLAQNKMLASKLLQFQAEQVQDLASRGLITDTIASEVEHNYHHHARGLLRMKMAQAGNMSNFMAPMGLVTGLASPAVDFAQLVVSSGPVQRLTGFLSSRPRRSARERAMEADQASEAVRGQRGQD